MKKLTKEDALVRSRALVSFGVSASIAIVKEDICELGNAIGGLERTLEDLKAYHTPRVVWLLGRGDDDDELGSEG